ncbi:MAG: ion transporter [Pseudonocardiaceae bacterium]|nr:ion transporter [Pseudonocardiaceae bacterium]
MTWRERVRQIVEHRGFQRFIITVIVVNAVTLGLETSEGMLARFGDLLHFADRLALTIFVVELLLRLYAHRFSFFRDPWSVFDLAIVLIALMPMTGPFAVMRALRILRVLRLISVVPSMRRVVTGLLKAIPGMASIAAPLALIIYVAGVMTTKLFGDISPEHFGDLGTSLFSLFQVMTGEAWPDIAADVMAEAPLAWIFFVIYILVSSFAVLNLFIAVVVSAMEDQMRAEAQQEESRHAAEHSAQNEQILAELRQLRAEVAALRATS